MRRAVSEALNSKQQSVERLSFERSVERSSSLSLNTLNIMARTAKKVDATPESIEPPLEQKLQTEQSSQQNPQNRFRSNTVQGKCCAHCRSIFSKQANLNAHIKSKHEQIRFHCTFPRCDKTFTAKCSLQRHFQNTHMDEPETPTAQEANELEYDADFHITESAMLTKVIRLDRRIKKLDEEIPRKQSAKLKLISKVRELEMSELVAGKISDTTEQGMLKKVIHLVRRNAEMDEEIWKTQAKKAQLEWEIQKLE